VGKLKQLALIIGDFAVVDDTSQVVAKTLAMILIRQVAYKVSLLINISQLIFVIMAIDVVNIFLSSI
jgi:hypothetical protein